MGNRSENAAPKVERDVAALIRKGSQLIEHEAVFFLGCESGMFAKFGEVSFDGRIDDPNAGWKGRGLWATYDERALTHIEGGKGTYSKVVKFQMRPDPFAH